jgi:hypothetical protein
MSQTALGFPFFRRGVLPSLHSLDHRLEFNEAEAVPIDIFEDGARG